MFHRRHNIASMSSKSCLDNVCMVGLKDKKKRRSLCDIQPIDACICKCELVPGNFELEILLTLKYKISDVLGYIYMASRLGLYPFTFKVRDLLGYIHMASNLVLYTFNIDI